MTLTLVGTDNSGKPRQLYACSLAKMDETEFRKEAEMKIWLSAYASNNRRSDYHWQCDACYDEAQRREKPEIYTEAWEKASAQ